MQKSKLTIAEIANYVPQILKKRSCNNRNARKKFKSYTTSITREDEK